jgi:hypothetical protein
MGSWPRALSGLSGVDRVVRGRAVASTCVFGRVGRGAGGWGAPPRASSTCRRRIVPRPRCHRWRPLAIVARVYWLVCVVVPRRRLCLVLSMVTQNVYGGGARGCFVWVCVFLLFLVRVSYMPYMARFARYLLRSHLTDLTGQLWVRHNEIAYDAARPAVPPARRPRPRAHVADKSRRRLRHRVRVLRALCLRVHGDRSRHHLAAGLVLHERPARAAVSRRRLVHSDAWLSSLRVAHGSRVCKLLRAARWPRAPDPRARRARRRRPRGVVAWQGATTARRDR